MSTHNLCFEQKYEKYQIFLSEKLHFLVAKFSVYLNRHVFVMEKAPSNVQNANSDHPEHAQSIIWAFALHSYIL